MGFDIIGIRPINYKGEGFSRNIRSWMSIWLFISQHCNDILTDLQIEQGFANDGIKINACQSKLIIKRLQNIINSEVTIDVNKAQSQFKGATMLSLLDVQKVLGINSSLNNQDLRSDLIEFIEFARYSSGFKIC